MTIEPPGGAMNPRLVKDTFFLDPVSRQYLVVVDTGDEAGVTKTYVITDGSLPKLLRYSEGN